MLAKRGRTSSPTRSSHSADFRELRVFSDIKSINGSLVTQSLYQCAIARYPNEACGFIVQSTGEKYRFIEARNVSEDPVNEFVMHHEDVIAAEDEGR